MSSVGNAVVIISQSHNTEMVPNTYCTRPLHAYYQHMAGIRIVASNVWRENIYENRTLLPEEKCQRKSCHNFLKKKLKLFLKAYRCSAITIVQKSTTTKTKTFFVKVIYILCFFALIHNRKTLYTREACFVRKNNSEKNSFFSLILGKLIF